MTLWHPDDITTPEHTVSPKRVISRRNEQKHGWSKWYKSDSLTVTQDSTPKLHFVPNSVEKHYAKYDISLAVTLFPRIRIRFVFKPLQRQNTWSQRLPGLSCGILKQHNVFIRIRVLWWEGALTFVLHITCKMCKNEFHLHVKMSHNSWYGGFMMFRMCWFCCIQGLVCYLWVISAFPFFCILPTGIKWVRLSLKNMLWPTSVQ